MKKIITIILLTGFYMSANAGAARVETDSFLFELPNGWKIEELSSQAKLTGPNGEVVILSSTRITGSENKEEWETIKTEIGSNITNAMKRAADHPDLVVKGSLRQFNVRTFPFFELQSETKDGAYFFDQFGIIGPKNAILITVEGDIMSKQSSSIVKKAIENITWY